MTEKRKKRFKITGILAAVILILCLGLLSAYLYQIKSTLQHEVEVGDIALEESREQLDFHQRLAALDSLIWQGYYDRAANQLKSWRDTMPEEIWRQDHLQQRQQALERKRSQRGDDELLQEKLQSQLQHYRDSINALRDSLHQKQRTHMAEQVAMQEAQRLLDTEVSRLEKKLAEEEKHRFLSFRNAKGSKVYYLGETHDGQAHGKGIGIWLSGSKYEGEWRNNLRYGQGVFEWADGERYEGEFRNDNRHGKGTYYWNNGEKYVGQWQNDRRNGDGVFYGKEGNVIARGRWENDELVQPKNP